MTITDLGKDGPHPDLVPKLVESLRKLPEQIDHPAAQWWADVTDPDMQLLQQRTVYDASWTNPLNGDTGQLDISIGLMLCTPPNQRKSIVSFMGLRWPGRDWGIAQSGNAWLDDLPKQEITSELFGTPGIGIGWGVVVHSPEIASGRITLADGRAFNGLATDGSFLILVLLDSYEIYTSPMQLALLDVDGREIQGDPVTFDIGS